MNKMAYCPSDESEALFLKRLNDIYSSSKRSEIVKYTSFLNEREQIIAENFAERNKISFVMYGGYEHAVRKVGAFMFDGNYESIPISAVTFTFRKTDKPDNRDFLGAAMSLGIERKLLGDILVGEGYAVIFCITAIEQLLLNQLDKIGRIGVKTEKGVLFALPEVKFAEISGVVASLRVDCLAAELTGFSRDKVNKIIEAGLVQINYVVCNQKNKSVKINDVITIRGTGKFILSEIGNITRKGNMHIKFKKYI